MAIRPFDTVSSGRASVLRATRAFNLGSAFVVHVHQSTSGASRPVPAGAHAPPPPRRCASCGDRRRAYCHLCRDAWPVEPGIAFGARQLETWAMACGRSTSSPLSRARRTLLVCALTTSLTVRACSKDVPPAMANAACPSPRPAGLLDGDLDRAGGRAIARRIGIARPLAVDALGINRSVCLRRDPPSSDGLAHRCIGHPGGVRRHESKYPYFFGAPSIICSSFLRIELGFHLEQRVHTFVINTTMKGHGHEQARTTLTQIAQTSWASKPWKPAARTASISTM